MTGCCCAAEQLVGVRCSKMVLILTLLLTAVIAQEKEKVNECIKMKTCGDCLAAGPPCGWCNQDRYEASERCNIVDNLFVHGCDPGSIINPASTINYVKNESPRNAERDEDAIQLSPQEVNIKLRPNEPFKFSVSFRQAENYPVDLYYVMDLSYSMDDDKANLAKLGNMIASEMKKITKNFRLGFGSFVDKRTMPYVSTVPAKLKQPCDGCAAPYGFHHQLQLTTNASRFESEVINAPISGNLDSPEGGFDAIMQAISCEQEIGWRPQSRKMLLFSTDAGFHYAGDGKLGGVVTPNDGQCHLDSKGYYSESLNLDYPSISQLSHKIAKQKVNVIFAVTENQLPVYEKLSNFIEGSTSGQLANDSSNIVELVKENYQKISSSVELKSEADEDIRVTFKSRCTGKEMLEEEGSLKCDNLRIAQNVTFEVAVEAKSCPSDRRQWKKSFKISPVGLNEKLIVNVELDCECDCEKNVPPADQLYSPKCNGHGTYACGACICSEGYYGRLCQCDGSQLSTTDYDAACRQGNSSKVCSGRGKCVCGECECDPVSTKGDQSHRFSGLFCECSDYNCDYYDGMPCGGPTRGKCNCGKCDCLGTWTGPACGCDHQPKKCLTKSGIVCNNKGRCECGRCICDKDSKYKGPTCEDCPTCPGECDAKWPCVQCRAHRTYSTLSKEECDAKCSHIIVVDEFEEHEKPDDYRKCIRRDDDGCDAEFEYYYHNETIIYAKKTKECPAPVNILAIILGVIAAILILGLLLLLCWKVFVTIHDRREYARFEKERENARWDMGENPVYKPATTSYKNPMYANNR